MNNLTPEELEKLQSILQKYEEASFRAGQYTIEIATYKGGKWVFSDYNEKKLFWFLFSIYKNDFGKALKQYIRSLDEKPKTYMIECAARRFNIKITKLKRNISNKFYNIYPTK